MEINEWKSELRPPAHEPLEGHSFVISGMEVGKSHHIEWFPFASLSVSPLSLECLVEINVQPSVSIQSVFEVSKYNTIPIELFNQKTNNTAYVT